MLVQGGDKLLTVIDVYRSIVELTTLLVQNYPITDRDIDDTVDRPCCFLDVDNITSSMETVEYMNDSAHFELYYFYDDLDTGFLELLKIKNTMLPRLLKGLLVQNDKEKAYVSCDNLSAEISKADKGLRISFDVMLVQQVKDEISDNADYMYELEVNE